MNDTLIQPKKNKTCVKCKTNFVYKEEESYWSEAGTYSVKLVKCCNCGCINPIKYIDAFGLSVNSDDRYYK